MDIILLAAGMSKRMGKTNKLLLPYNNSVLVCHSAMQALKFLEKENGHNRLIVVTGYRRRSTEKALQPCKTFIEKTKSSLEMIIINNPDYRKGQFSSTKVGVSQLDDKCDFFISLADMPEVAPRHYKKIAGLIGKYDAVRPFCGTQPGHPVFCKAKIKKAIMKAKTDSKVCRILEKFNVYEPDLKNRSLIYDIDTPSDSGEHNA